MISGCRLDDRGHEEIRTDNIWSRTEDTKPTTCSASRSVDREEPLDQEFYLFFVTHWPCFSA